MEHELIGWVGAGISTLRGKRSAGVGVKEDASGVSFGRLGLSRDYAGESYAY